MWEGEALGIMGTGRGIVKARRRQARSKYPFAKRVHAPFPYVRTHVENRWFGMTCVKMLLNTLQLS